MIESLLAHSSDLTIGITLFAGFALAGIGASVLSYSLVGRRLADDHKSLAETVEKSIFAFSIFVLALTLADVRSNFSKSSDNVIAEAFAIRQLTMDLDLDQDSSMALEKATLKAYAQAVIDDEWRTLSEPIPALSPVAGARLEELRAMVRADAAREGRNSRIDRTWSAISGLENLRQMRLQEATAAAPQAFWVFTLLLMGTGAVMTGRARFEWGRTLILFEYFGALGLIVALILILDRPFRGETSVSPEPIRAVIARLR